MPVPKFPCAADRETSTPITLLAGQVQPEIPDAGDSIPETPFNQMSPAEREQILMEHLPVVRYIARRIHEHLPAHVEMDDLVSAGMVGLADAFNKFDAGKKVQFRSYAQFRIRGAILDSLRTLDWSPRELRRKGRAIETAMHKLTGRLGRTPMENEVAAEMDMSLDEYQHLLTDLRGLEIGSLDVAHSEDSSDDEVAYVPSSPEEGPLFQCLKAEMRARLADAITALPERERLVLTLYYYEEMTMKEIGLTLDVVESRVSQIHTSAVLHLRSLLANDPAKAAHEPNLKPDGGRSKVHRPGNSVAGMGPLGVRASDGHPIVRQPQEGEGTWISR
ncbi:MAG: FliA/WhiG family RNA polymerase sigma factor [Acidobacteriaceae bacterium]